MLPQFVQILAEKARSLEINYPNIDKGEIGLFFFAPQAQTVATHVHEAVSKEARLIIGGEVEIHEGGLYMRATVIDEANHDMRAMTEETFGPIAPVMCFTDIAEAVRLANDTEYGLTAAVFGPSQEAATAVEYRLMPVRSASTTAIYRVRSHQTARKWRSAILAWADHAKVLRL